MGKRRAEDPEPELRKWLRSHHSVISRREAVRLGASNEVIVLKLKKGEWSRMYRGVFRDTAAKATTYQKLRGACLAVPDGGVISHESAAWLWGLMAKEPTSPEVSVPSGNHGGRGIKGIIIHRYSDLDPSQAVLREEILVTNPLRTIVDLAATVSPARLTEVVDAALAKRLVTLAGLVAELDRLAHRGRPGVGRLRSHLLERGFIGAPTASVLESRMHRIVASTGLPPPTLEMRVGVDGEYRLDIAWPAILYALEVDGYVWHFTPEHQQRDLNRRNKLQDGGWTIRLYTWRDVGHEPARVAREIVATYNRLAGGAQTDEPAAKSSTI